MSEPSPQEPSFAKRLANWFSRNVFLVLLIIFTLILLIYIPTSYHTDPLREQVVLRQGSDLQPFQIIGQADVVTQTSVIETSAFTTTDNLVGRYTLQSISAGSVVRKDQVSDFQLSPTDMANRVIISLPLKVGAIDRALKPGTRVTLVFSPRDGCCDQPITAIALEDVIVWGVDRRDEGASVVVAVKGAGCANAIAPYLGVSEVFMWFPPAGDGAGAAAAASPVLASVILSPPCQPPSLPDPPTNTPTDVPISLPSDTPLGTPLITPTGTPRITNTRTPTEPPGGIPTSTPTSTPMQPCEVTVTQSPPLPAALPCTGASAETAGLSLVAFAVAIFIAGFILVTLSSLRRSSRP